MTNQPDGFRLFGGELAHELAAQLLRGDREGAHQRIHRLLTNWGVNNGIVETLVCDLVSQYASTLLRLYDGDQIKAAEAAERIALDKEVESAATNNAINDVVISDELKDLLDYDPEDPKNES